MLDFSSAFLMVCFRSLTEEEKQQVNADQERCLDDAVGGQP